MTNWKYFLWELRFAHSHTLDWEGPEHRMLTTEHCAKVTRRTACAISILVTMGVYFIHGNKSSVSTRIVKVSKTTINLTAGKASS